MDFMTLSKAIRNRNGHLLVVEPIEAVGYREEYTRSSPSSLKVLGIIPELRL